ncbi:tyrosine-protein kinase Fer-like isoform X2 [Crassostrea virginica]
MATDNFGAQDIIRCTLCEDAAKFHCSFCAVVLCQECIPNHLLSDKSKKHEILNYTTQPETHSPRLVCCKHNKSICEIYCNDCKTEVCSKCVIGEHREHDLADLDDAVEEKKLSIVREIGKVESTTLVHFQEQKHNFNEEEYEKAFQAISAQEELICEAVKKIGSKVREEVSKHKKENEDMAKKNEFQEKKILRVIETTKCLLSGNCAKSVLDFEGLKSQLLNESPNIVDTTAPYLQAGEVNVDHLNSMFGSLVFAPSQNEMDICGGEDLEEKPWYHGFITNEVSEQILKKNGDFLIRKARNGLEHYIISSFRDGTMHHSIITKDDIVQSVGRKGTIVQYVHQLETMQSSDFKSPVNRNRYQLDYNEIRLIEEKITCDQRFLKGTFKDQAVSIETNEDDETMLFKNAYFLQFFNHPNIVRCFGYSATHQPVLLVLEEISELSFNTYLRRNGKAIPAAQKIEMCLSIARGVAYIHLYKYAHRDIATRCCMITSNGVVKIADFQLAEKEHTDLGGKQFPVKWSALEVFYAGTVELKSDVWSFGVFIWEVFSSGQIPYSETKNKDLLDLIEKVCRSHSRPLCV